MAYQSHGGRRANMKKGIHPNYVETKVTCACGNTFTVKSKNKTITRLFFKNFKKK